MDFKEIAKKIGCSEQKTRNIYYGALLKLSKNKDKLEDIKYLISELNKSKYASYGERRYF